MVKICHIIILNIWDIYYNTFSQKRIIFLLIQLWNMPKISDTKSVVLILILILKYKKYQEEALNIFK